MANNSASETIHSCPNAMANALGPYEAPLACHISLPSYLALQGPTVIKGKLLLSSYKQLWAVQYGEVSK